VSKSTRCQEPALKATMKRKHRSHEGADSELFLGAEQGPRRTPELCGLYSIEWAKKAAMLRKFKRLNPNFVSRNCQTSLCISVANMSNPYASGEKDVKTERCAEGRSELHTYQVSAGTVFMGKNDVPLAYFPRLSSTDLRPGDLNAT
jgi:hypothetical protein